MELIGFPVAAAQLSGSEIDGEQREASVIRNGAWLSTSTLP